MICHTGRQGSATAWPISQDAPPNRNSVTPTKTVTEAPSRLSIMTPSVAAFEVRGAHLLVRQHLPAAAAEGDAADHHHIAAVGELQRMVGVLLDQEHRHAIGSAHVGTSI